MKLRRFRSKRGQSLVEFTLILPVIMFLVLGMTEMGFAINHNTSIVTATRQGARVGSELVDGVNRDGKQTSASAASNAVDPLIIAAVEGVLVSPGSPVNISQVTKIEIFLADSTTGAMTGSVNTWIPGTGTQIPGTSPAQYLHFSKTGGNWNTWTRTGGGTAQSIGVRITYTYKFITPLGGILAAFNTNQITMTDQTIMAMEPPTPS
jgi:Flp pilus assembly protein TadG